MALPVAAPDFVGDESIARELVRYAKQSLGQAHQRNPFVGREGKFMHQCVDAAGVATPPSQSVDQPTGQRLRVDMTRTCCRLLRQQGMHQRALVLFACGRGSRKGQGRRVGCVHIGKPDTVARHRRLVVVIEDGEAFKRRCRLKAVDCLVRKFGAVPSPTILTMGQRLKFRQAIRVRRPGTLQAYTKIHAHRETTLLLLWQWQRQRRQPTCAAALPARYRWHNPQSCDPTRTVPCPIRSAMPCGSTCRGCDTTRRPVPAPPDSARNRPATGNGPQNSPAYRRSTGTDLCRPARKTHHGSGSAPA